ncbi:MAG: hypothetical protein AB1635_06215 [Acidobacteriota bacterium]
MNPRHVAVVVANDEPFGTARMWSLLMLEDVTTIDVFRQPEDDALAWLRSKAGDGSREG